MDVDVPPNDELVEGMVNAIPCVARGEMVVRSDGEVVGLTSSFAPVFAATAKI